ncbi:hypothetical protein DM01DRAFT_1379865 [Hesseltinella vesiculosa]|uniref:BHLH domain-containing protein n=1 Tax=Hesseltinella vesiculosa TaxID=101127 RepID=A0A1X2GWK5_9FUNG|nr:hypothetical protein DM01DRAFT_1379865 [Hesseltinella vesiculosa]
MNPTQEDMPTPKPALRLLHPTAYHLQQQRLKAMDIDPTLDHSQVVLAQQQNEGSPYLSDIDYADLTSPASLPPSDYGYTDPRMTMHRPDQEMYDDRSMDGSLAYSNMKRPGAKDATQQDLLFYSPPHQASSPLEQRFRHQFAVSAPVNIVYHPHSPAPQQHSFPSSSYNDDPFIGSAPSLSYSAKPESNSLENQPDSLETYEDDYAAQTNLQAIMDKRRRRRESHNAVERRRRDNINERIQELGTLLPDALDDGVNRFNKGTILKKSVEQIKTLQQELAQYRQRVQELESVLQQINVHR